MNTAYQRKKQSLKINLRLKSVHIIKRSEEKDDLKSVKVYKFNNTKENWHEYTESLLIAEVTMELLMEICPLLMNKKQSQSLHKIREMH